MTAGTIPNTTKAPQLIPTYCEYVNKYLLQPAARAKTEVPGEHHFVALYLVPRLCLFPFLGVPHYVNPDGMKAIAGDVVYYSYAPEHDVYYVPSPRLKIEVKLENPRDRAIQLTRTQYYHWIRQEWSPEKIGGFGLSDRPEQPDVFVGVSKHGIAIRTWRDFRDVFIGQLYPQSLPAIPKVKGRPSNTLPFAMSHLGWDKPENSGFCFPYSLKTDEWPALEVSFVKSLETLCRASTSQDPLIPLQVRPDIM